MGCIQLAGRVLVPLAFQIICSTFLPPSSIASGATHTEYPSCLAREKSIFAKGHVPCRIVKRIMRKHLLQYAWVGLITISSVAGCSLFDCGHDCSHPRLAAHHSAGASYLPAPETVTIVNTQTAKADVTPPLSVSPVRPLDESSSSNMDTIPLSGPRVLALNDPRWHQWPH
jgi:hypothetical protein